MKKKFLSLLLAIVLLPAIFMLVACGNNQGEKALTAADLAGTYNVNRLEFVMPEGEMTADQISAFQSRYHVTSSEKAAMKTEAENFLSANNFQYYGMGGPKTFVVNADGTATVTIGTQQLTYNFTINGTQITATNANDETDVQTFEYIPASKSIKLLSESHAASNTKLYAYYLLAE